jgi:branched-chain amino acid transport system ATP-binding protein
VIRDINLVLHPGEVVGLFGANGAGKTTTMLALAGELMPLDGEVELHGEVTRDPLYRRAQNGLMFVTEEKSVIMGLTTRDNLRVGGVDIDIALGLFPELEKRINIMGGLLSGGEQQMLSLARALGRNPRILLADELSLGLAPIVVQRLLQAVRDAAAELGMAVLLVEQHVRQALKFADRAYIMRRGTVEISGTTGELMSRISDIEETYLTSSHWYLPSSRYSLFYCTVSTEKKTLLSKMKGNKVTKATMKSCKTKWRLLCQM